MEFKNSLSLKTFLKRLQYEPIKDINRNIKYKILQSSYGGKIAALVGK
jgi:hypothetical protein